jgi:peptide/nickel transport system substrate-binding protein
VKKKLCLAFTVLFAVMWVVSASAQAKTSKNDLIISVNSDPLSLDPWYAVNNANRVTKNAVYERLFFTDESGNIQPQLAEKWEWSKDKMALIVHLRKGVKFHNGAELKASDVVYSYKKAGKSPVVTAQIDFIDYDYIKADNDYTVRIPMKRPIAFAVKSMAGVALFVVNEKFTKDNGENLTFVSCGTGPYKLNKYTPNVDCSFTRFDGYWGAKAPCATMTLRVIQEASQALVELESGNIDILTYPNQGDVTSVKKGQVKGAKVKVTPAIMTLCFYFNLQKKPFDNKLVRQAIAYAINRDDAVTAAYMGNGTVAKSVLASGVWGYDKKYDTYNPYPYNPTKAKELLKKAGYPNGFKMKIVVASSNVERVTMCEVIQNNLKQVGIDCSVQQMEYSAFRAALVDGKDDDAFIFGTTATTGEADNALYCRFYKDLGKSVGFYGWPSQPECVTVSSLLDKARGAYDDKARKSIYDKVQEVLFDSVPVIPLSEATIFSILDEKVEGFQIYSEYDWTGSVYFK